jgi:hypothetical protein
MPLVVFCRVDDALRHLRLGRPRSRGPAPILPDAGAISIEVVGELPGPSCDTAIYAHFRRHHRADFPALARVHRTTSLRRAANPWRVKRAPRRGLAARLLPGDPCRLADGAPAYACEFSRARYGRLFRGEASHGCGHAQKQTCHGFRLRARAVREGAVRAFEPAPADVSDRAALPSLGLPAGSAGVGDRSYSSPGLRDGLAAAGVTSHAALSSRRKGPDPGWAKALSRERRLVEAVRGQLAGRYDVERVRARDAWHLAHRAARKVLSHTAATMLCVRPRPPPLPFARLLAARRAATSMPRPAHLSFNAISGPLYVLFQLAHRDNSLT